MSLKCVLLQTQAGSWRVTGVSKALQFTKIIFEVKTILYILSHHKREHIDVYGKLQKFASQVPLCGRLLWAEDGKQKA